MNRQAIQGFPGRSQKILTFDHEDRRHRTRDKKVSPARPATGNGSVDALPDSRYILSGSRAATETCYRNRVFSPVSFLSRRGVLQRDEIIFQG